MRKRNSDNKKKKKDKSILEAEIMMLMQKALDAAIKKGLDDIFKGFK